MYFETRVIIKKRIKKLRSIMMDYREFIEIMESKRSTIRIDEEDKRLLKISEGIIKACKKEILEDISIFNYG